MLRKIWAWIKRSGRRLWKPVATGAFLTVLAAAIAARWVTIVDTTGNSGPIFFQALLGGQVAFLALVLAGVGLAVQVRASAVGPDMAVAAVRDFHLVLAGGVYLASLGLTGGVLARWPLAVEEGDGAAIDFVVVLAVVTRLARVCTRYAISGDTGDPAHTHCCLCQHRLALRPRWPR